MKKILFSLVLATILLLVPWTASGNGFSITPMGPLELDIPANGSATQDFIVTGLEGTLLIELENLPLDYEPHEIEVTDGQTITVTFYGDGTNNFYEGKIRFRPAIGGDVLIGYKVTLLASIHLEVDVPNSLELTTTILEPARLGGSGGSGRFDTRPPVIFNVAHSNITETGAIIGWKTDERATSQVGYWASPLLFSELDETLLIFHRVVLTNLNPGTTYYYETMSEDRYGNQRISGEYTFTTLKEAALPELEEPIEELTPEEPTLEEPTLEEPTLEEPVIEEPPESEEPLKPILGKGNVPWGLIVGIIIGSAVAVSGIIYLRRERKLQQPRRSNV